MDHQKQADDLLAKAKGASTSKDPSDLWKILHRELLSPTIPFEVHQLLLNQVYGKETLIKPTWFPKDSSPSTNIEKFNEMHGLGSFQDLYQFSITERNDFWLKVANDALGIKWNKHPTVAIDDGSYYTDGILNIADSILKPSDRPALVYANDTDPENLQTLSVSELNKLVDSVAAAIAQRWEPRTRIAVCLPLTPEAVAVYLGILKAGCVVVSIADSFSASEIRVRCEIADVRAIFTQDVILRPQRVIPMYTRVLEALVDPESTRTDDAQTPVVVLPASLHASHYDSQVSNLNESVDLRDIDSFWDDFLVDVDCFESVVTHASDIVNILFSSGTTGTPKAIPWSHSTYIKSAADGYFHQNLKDGSIIAWPTSLGWMMGSWLIAQRINGATICLYQGLPHSEKFCSFISKSRVSMLGVIPSLVEVWKRKNSGLRWDHIKCFSSTGEASSPETSHWLSSRVPGYAPILEYCGGTEIGGSFLSSSLLHPNVPSMFSCPVLGAEVILLDAAEAEFKQGTPLTNHSGELILRGPSVGFSMTLLNRSHHNTYFAGMPDIRGVQARRHGDEFEIIRDDCGLPYFRALGRTDDTMNLGGIKISSIEIERACAMPGISEIAAVGVSSPSKLILFVVTDQNEDKNLKSYLQHRIKKHLNPLFAVSDVQVVEKLPRTASNKVLRRQLRDQYLEYGIK